MTTYIVHRKVSCQQTVFQYVNKLYFDGQLDFSTKEGLKKGLEKKEQLNNLSVDQSESANKVYFTINWELYWFKQFCQDRFVASPNLSIPEEEWKDMEEEFNVM